MSTFDDRFTPFAPVVAAAAQKYGVPFSYLKTMALIESGANPKAVSPTGCKGFYQFTEATARQYGIIGKEFDAAANIDAGARLARDNAATMARKGIDVTPAYLYLAHQQGVGGLKQLLEATDTGVVTPALRRNMDVNGGKGKSPAEFVAMWVERYHAKAHEAGAEDAAA